jgi:hypothetical protein
MISVAALGLKLLPVWKAVKKVLTISIRLPLGVILLAAVIAFIWHGNKIEAAFASGETAANTKWAAEFKKMDERAKKLEQRVEVISQEVRSKNDEEARRIGGHADDLRLRGPGKAACPNTGSVTVTSGGHQSPSGKSGAPVGGVPDQARVDIIGLPFPGTIATGEVCDLNRNEVISWRNWYQRLSTEWRKTSK